MIIATIGNTESEEDEVKEGERSETMKDENLMDAPSGTCHDREGDKDSDNGAIDSNAPPSQIGVCFVVGRTQGCQASTCNHADRKQSLSQGLERDGG